MACQPAERAVFGTLALLGVGIVMMVICFHSRVFLESPELLLLSTSLRKSGACVASKPCTFEMVADLDELSLAEDGKFRSYMLNGRIHKTAKGGYAVEWGIEIPVGGSINVGNRGMELSELIFWNGKMLSFDDRTGIVFEHLNSGVNAVPRHIVSAGGGNEALYMKIEWATVKDDKLWIGSFGKEFVGKDGQKMSVDNMWVAILSREGQLTRVHWADAYAAIRRELGAEWPRGYVIHEAVNWSSYLQKWVFLPRRVSNEPYDELRDELKGSNKLILANENFSVIEVRHVGTLIPQRGFSSFKFMPGTNDSVILAVKTVELSLPRKMCETYLTVFDLDGEVLLEDVKVPTEHKYEGIEFLQS